MQLAMDEASSVQLARESLMAGYDTNNVFAKILRGELPSLSAEADVSPAIDRVMVRGMASDPAFRYPSCGDLIGAARRALAEG